MNSAAPNGQAGSTSQRGLGLAAAVPADVIVQAAQAVQAADYHSFWLNNPPGADALTLLGQEAQSVRIHLGVGVIPLSGQPAAEIVQGVRRHHLPQERLYLGIGSGAGAGGVQRVADGLATIRSELSCQIVVAALGPRMCRLAGAKADGVLLNWLTPDFASRSVEWIREGAKGANRAAPRLMAYVRVALGAESRARLEVEAATYERIPTYAAHFERMGVGAMETAITGTTPDEIQRGLAAWDGIVDEVVVRAIVASDSMSPIAELIGAAKLSH